MGQIDGSLRPVQAVLTAASGSQAFLLQFLIQIIVILGRRREPGVPAETTGITGLCLSGREPRVSHLYTTSPSMPSPIITHEQ